MKSRRLFFALWLDEPAARAAHRAACEVAERIGGRAMRPESLHLTLAFLGNTPEERITPLLRLAETLATSAPAFTLQLDYLGYWPRKHLVWASCRRPATPLGNLAGGLTALLRADDFPTDPRPFHPHVTLLRNVRASEPALGDLPPITCAASQFRLVESIPLAAGGVRHQMLQCWPLLGSPPARPGGDPTPAG